MKDYFQCGHCRTYNPFSRFTRMNWNGVKSSDGSIKAVAQRCGRCGASHGVLRGEAEVISPIMMPTSTHGRVSPWYPPEYRPIIEGCYECEFRDGPTLSLYWNGWYWAVSIVDARRVQVRTMYKWRGVWP